jgi:hypothetical protein
MAIVRSPSGIGFAETADRTEIADWELANCIPEICNPLSAIYNPQLITGGIAQLVERQLCKLEVRGSNPLASIFGQRKCRAVVPSPAERRPTTFNVNNEP